MTAQHPGVTRQQRHAGGRRGYPIARLQFDTRREVRKRPAVERDEVDIGRPAVPEFVARAFVDQHDVAGGDLERRLATDRNLVLLIVHQQQVLLASVLQQVARARAAHRGIEAARHRQAAGQRHRFHVDADIVAVGRREFPPTDMPGHEIMHESQPLAPGNILGGQSPHGEWGGAHLPDPLASILESAQSPQALSRREINCARFGAILPGMTACRN